MSEPINLRRFVRVNEQLFPVIFENPEQIYSTVLAGLKRIAAFWWTDTQRMFAPLHKQDLVLYGDIAGYLYNNYTEVSLGFLCAVPEEMAALLPQINQTLIDNEVKYKLINRPIHCRLLTELPENVPAYSLESLQWLARPHRQDLPFSGEDLCREFADYQQAVQQYAQGLPKLENGLLVPDSCRQLEAYLQQQEQAALSARSHNPDHEYCLEYLLWRTFRNLGDRAYFQQYIANSYNYNINALEQY